MFKAVKDGATYRVTKNGIFIARCFNKYSALKAIWVHNGSKADEYYSFADETTIKNVGVKDKD